MEAMIVIADSNFDKLIKEKIDEALTRIDTDTLIERKLNSKVDALILKTLSPDKIQDFVKDRVTRIITTDSLKDYTSHLQAGDVLSNVESKILLMIKNSKDFKQLVKETLKQAL